MNKKYELVITCNKENCDKIEDYCENINKLMDCEDITGDAATESTYAILGAMSLTKEQISLIYKDLYTHKIICNIEILESEVE